MAVALCLNFCFSSEVSWQFCWHWLSGDAESHLPFPELELSPSALQNQPRGGMSMVFFPQSDQFQQWLVPACSENLSGWLKISLWPEGYGLLKEFCLKKQTGKKPNRRSCFELSSVKGAADSGMACFFGDTLRPTR